MQNGNGYSTWVKTKRIAASLTLVVSGGLVPQRPSFNSWTQIRRPVVSGSSGAEESKMVNPALLGVVGSESKSEYDTDDTRPLIEVRFEDGKLFAKDVSRDGIDPGLYDWLVNVLEENEDYLVAVFESGLLESFTFTLDGSDIDFGEHSGGFSDRGYGLGGNYDLEGKVKIAFPHSTLILQAADLSETIKHELVHVLIDAISRDKDLMASPEVDRFLNVCGRYQDLVLEQMKTGYEEIANYLETYQSNIETPSPVIAYMIEQYRSGDISSLMPRGEREWDFPEMVQFGKRSDICTVNYFEDQIKVAEDIVGENFTYNLLEPTDPINTIIGRFEYYLYKVSAYRFVKEGTYWNSPAGHPDNDTEFAASVIAIASNPTHYDHYLLYDASDEERDLIIEATEATTDLIALVAPGLRTRMDACVADVKVALDIEQEPLESVSDKCLGR